MLQTAISAVAIFLICWDLASRHIVFGSNNFFYKFSTGLEVLTSTQHLSYSSGRGLLYVIWEERCAQMSKGQGCLSAAVLPLQRVRVLQECGSDREQGRPLPGKWDPADDPTHWPLQAPPFPAVPISLVGRALWRHEGTDRGCKCQGP